MHRIETQKVRVCLNGAKIVDRDHFDICATAFDDGTQNIAPDTTETVDCYFDCHDAVS